MWPFTIYDLSYLGSIIFNICIYIIESRLIIFSCLCCLKSLLKTSKKLNSFLRYKFFFLYIYMFGVNKEFEFLNKHMYNILILIYRSILYRKVSYTMENIFLTIMHACKLICRWLHLLMFWCFEVSAQQIAYERLIEYILICIDSI